MAKSYSCWRFSERLCGPWRQGPCLWLHGASLGECRMLLGVIRSLSASGQDWGPMLLTTQKAEILEPLRSWVPANCQVAMAPLDLPWVRRAFWAQVQPWALVLGENELWPGWLKECGRRNIPVALVSGRFRRAFPGIDLRALRFAALQAENDLDHLLPHLVNLGCQPVVGGDWKSLEFAMAGPSHGATARPVSLALLSVHKEEWSSLRGAVGAACSVGKAVVLAPRRLDEIAFFTRAVAQSGIPTCRWPQTDNGGVSIVQEFGRIPELVAQSRTAFVGGSFCRAGVHDFWEPLRAGCAVWVGRNLHPHEAVLESLIRKGLVGRLSSGESFPRGFEHAPEKVSEYLAAQSYVIQESFAGFRTWLGGVRGATFRP